jgi:hypothetical protein
MQQQVSGHATAMPSFSSVKHGDTNNGSIVIWASAKNPVPNHVEAEPQKHAASINISPPPSQEDLRNRDTNTSDTEDN